MHNPAPVGHRASYLTLMLGFCICFGLAMIANTFVAGDGMWFWYADLFRHGSRLYADMHLALQPFFILETTTAMKLFGGSWMASRLVGVVHLLIYSVGMLLVVRQAAIKDGEKALVLGSAFFISLLSIAYRFDDYHVLAESFELYCLVLLLKFRRQQEGRVQMLQLIALGALSGLSFTTRVNDGAALFVGVAVAVFCLAPARRVLALIVLTASTFFTVVSVVKMTGDSFHDYVLNSMLRAAGSKGGASHILAYPISLPLNAIPWLHSRMWIYCCILAAVWVYLLRPLITNRDRQTLIKAVVGLLIVIVPMHYVLLHFRRPDLVLGVSAAVVFALYIFGLIVCFRALRWLASRMQDSIWDRREILMLIPLGQLAALAMSTGGMHYGIYGPTGFFILLLPIASPVRMPSHALRSVCMFMAALLIVYGAVFRFQEPYSWHSYVAQPMFAGRQMYHHRVYGWMYVESDLLSFIEPVCRQINSGEGASELLSLPYPFGNYFCAVPPWHGYVQTFYDTSTKETIAALVTELNASPPKWILYQNQAGSLAAHERVFNHGQPLAHRRLEQLQTDRIADGKWIKVYSSPYGSTPEWPDEWVLIRTR